MTAKPLSWPSFFCTNPVSAFVEPILCGLDINDAS